MIGLHNNEFHVMPSMIHVKLLTTLRKGHYDEMGIEE